VVDMAPREVVIAGKSYSNIAANDQAQLHIGDNISGCPIAIMSLIISYSYRHYKHLRTAL
jgi:hypothetical protein